MALYPVIRKGTAAQWASDNPILKDGQEGYETDTRKRKVGDGTTAWNSLSYDASDGGGGSLTDGSVTTAKLATEAVTDAKMAPDAKIGSLAALATTIKTSLVNAINELKGLVDSKEASIGAKGSAFNKNFGSVSGTVAEGNDVRLSDARTPLAHTHTLSSITDAGSAASKTAPTTGVNATTSQVVMGDDTRLTNSRAPIAHTHTSADVTDLTEFIQDTMASTLVNSASVTYSYNDVAGQITATSTGGSGGSYTHPNHTGDVTSVGDGSTTIANDVVTNAKLSNMATATIKGRTTAGTGDPEDLSVSQTKTLLSINNVDNTSDANKPISNATQTALNGKADLSAGKVPGAQLPDQYFSDTFFSGDGLTTGTAIEPKDNALTNAKLGSDIKIGSLAALTTTVKTSVQGAINELVTSLAGKVTGNSAVTGATKAKITYDAKGLVTAGTDLVEADIPTLSQSKVTSLTTDLAAKAPLVSPALTGTPTAPTATVGTNTTQIATTAFVLANAGSSAEPTFAQLVNSGASYVAAPTYLFDNMVRPSNHFSDIASGSSADITSLTVAGRNGVHRLITGSATNGRASSIRCYSISVRPFIVGQGDISLQALVAIPVLPDVTDNFSVQFGTVFSISQYDEKGNHFFCRGGNANWIARGYGAADTEFTTSVPIVAGQYYHLRIDINAAATEVKYYINSTLVHTITAANNIYSGSSNPVWFGNQIIKTAGTTSRELLIDAYYEKLSLTTSLL